MTAIPDLARQYRVPYKLEGQHHHVTKGWINFDCPYCSKDSGRYRLGFNLSGNYFSCWGCGSHQLYATFSQLFHVDLAEARELLKGVKPAKEVVKERATGKLVLPRHEKVFGYQHTKYLKKRGFDAATLVKLWDLRSIGIASRLQWRILIPLYYLGEIVSWTTRSLSDEVKAKYITAMETEETINHHHLLYGEDFVRHTAVVFEGPPSVWQVGPGAVCTLGKIFQQPQIEKLCKYQKVVVCYDSEEGAQKRARSLCYQLSLFTEVENVALRMTEQNLTKQQVKLIRKRYLD